MRGDANINAGHARINRQDIETLDEYHSLLESIIELQQQVNLSVTQHDIDLLNEYIEGLQETAKVAS